MHIRYTSRVGHIVRSSRYSSFRSSVFRRGIRIPPQYLLDDYTPRYMMLQQDSVDEKQAAAERHLRNCNLCPHNCSVDRYTTTGFCALGAERVPVATIAPHFGEESCITGTNGSGTVFFASCNLRCAFCQNYDISHVKDAGEMLTAEEVGGWMVKLQDLGGCHNINLVTPEHVVPVVAKAIVRAREEGLRIPVVYNTSSFDSVESLKLLDGLVDIYLADFKLWSPETAKRLLKSEKYPSTAREAIVEMTGQVGVLKFTGDGLAKQGVLIRHLIMPNYVEESKAIMRFIAEEVDKDSFVHIMSQYFPSGHVGRKSARGSGVRYEDINRQISDEEEEAVWKAAREVGLWRFNQAEQLAGYS
ncbi:hypothetical protein BZA70DRAFT_282358 [Myxozyma melibiosi]|uniref:Radical SAM core domain-containing protein n=1 Tax=Myxozyma melibiosi TaxID=54550 RepID=A0ABR1F218_9ASCO